jgi:hypothetical protein
MTSAAATIIQKLQESIGTDVGGRGMKHLICPNDLWHASRLLCDLPHNSSTVLILSGFPCCVSETPPTETDGPPGTVALARVVLALGHVAVVCTDDCNAAVYQAALQDLLSSKCRLECFSATHNDDHDRLTCLAASAQLVLACERAGPARDGICYTMKGIAMTGLVAPLHKLVTNDVPFVAIGDGGNELGMGKVLDKIEQHIPNGPMIACVVPATYLIAASVSNWGAYALAAAVAVLKANNDNVQTWIEAMLPTEQGEIDLLQRCVNQGCRDGVTGKVEATVDGMPLERSLQCLREIRNTCLGIDEKK